MPIQRLQVLSNQAQGVDAAVPTPNCVGTGFSEGYGDIIYCIGERGGTRTLDPMIKSHVLYRLSYALTGPLCRGRLGAGQ